MTTDNPSEQSEIIHKYSVLNRYIKFGYKKEDFPAENEREIINIFELLNKEEQEEQDKSYEELKNKFFSL